MRGDGEEILQTLRMPGAFRRIVAVLCMGLSFLLSSQTAFAITHQIEHAHHIPHSHALMPDEFFGAVIYLAGHDHPTPDSAAPPHKPEASDSQPAGLGLGHGPAPVDHQHGNSSVVFLLTQNLTLAGHALPKLRSEFVPQGLATFSPSGPDHPPKSSLEIRA